MKLKKEKVPAWDLSDIFKSTNDPKINSLLGSCQKRALSFSKRYRGKLINKLTTSTALYECLSEYEDINQDLSKPISFAQLVFSADQNNSANGAFLQKMRGRWAEIQKILVFFEIELAELPKSRFAKWIKTRALARYSNFLTTLLNNKKHMLDEKSEQLLTDLDLTGRSAFVRLYGEEQSAYRYNLIVNGKKFDLSETEVLNRLMQPNRNLREAAGKSFSTGLKCNIRRSAYIFNTLLEDKRIKDTYRNYKSPEASRHQANQINDKVVNTMTTVVVKNYKLVQKFYEFKAGQLGLKKLEYFDRLAPLGKLKLEFSFKQARSIILDAFHRFSAEYAGIAEEFFDKSWIDAQLRNGKRSGAYCSFMTPDLHPLVFMNFQGSLRDVFTLAHELGHAIHAHLMRGTSYLNYNIPLTIAEVASTFAELLVFEHLLELLPRREQRFALHANKIDNIIATVFRQTSMYRFEQSFHSARRMAGEQSPEKINLLWRKSQFELYRDSIKANTDYDYWWSYIPHFIHTPFYVYAYAFGDLMALSFYKKYKAQPSKFVPAYINMLAQGASVEPVQLVKSLGVSLNSSAFWEGGMQVFKDLIDQTEELA